MRRAAILIAALLGSSAFAGAAGASPLQAPAVSLPEIAAWSTPVQYYERPSHYRPYDYRERRRYEAPGLYDETAPRSQYISGAQIFQIVRSLGFEPVRRPRLIEDRFVVRAAKPSTGEVARIIIDARTGDVLATRTLPSFRDEDVRRDEHPRRDDRLNVRPSPRDQRPEAEAPSPGDESIPDDPPISQQTPRDPPRVARQAPRQDDPGFNDPRLNAPRFDNPRRIDPRVVSPRQNDPRQVERRTDPRQDPRFADPRQIDPGQDQQIDDEQPDPRAGRPAPQPTRQTR